MGNGPSQKVVDTSQQITNQQLASGIQQDQNAKEDRARAFDLQQPLIDKEKALSSGDRSLALAASMPVISKIAGGYQAAKDSVFNLIPPGPARDKALADIEVGKATATGGAMAGEVAKAPEILANLGSGLGAFSLQELGASLGGYGGAGTTNASTGNLQMKQSEAKWSPIIGLASAAGGAAGSYFGRPKSG